MLNLPQGRAGALIGIVIAGITAGTVATFAQMLLWWFDGTPVVPTLLRDARLTAAIVLGREVLPEDAGSLWTVMAWASFIHFALSIIYAGIAWPAARRMPLFVAALAGSLYGTAIYVVNLYGFTHLFPWFDVSRGPVTIAAHLVFGASLLASCAWLARAR